jgi:hypothetical protein
MLRLAPLSAVAATLAAFASLQSASAQVIAYDHRSTVLGDHLSGASELVRAQGAFLKDEADAAETWTRVVAAQDQIQYQRANYRFDVKRMQDDYRTRKAEANRERQQSAATSDAAAAMKLYQSIQRGAGLWPAALTQAKYSSSLSTVTSLMRNWSPDDPASDVYRVAAATELGVLKNRVAADRELDFASRVDAVRTLKQLQQLTMTPPAEFPRQWQQRQLAMK